MRAHRAPQPDTPVPSYGSKRVSSTGLAVTALLHLLLVLLFLYTPEKDEKAPPPSGTDITYIKELPVKPKLVEPPKPTAKPVKPVKQRKQEVVPMERLPDTITVPNENPVVREEPKPTPPPEPQPPKPVPVAPVEDMAATIAARQAARALQRAQAGEETASERATRVARANVESANGKTFGDDERETDVTIRHSSFNSATIRFEGWNAKYKRPFNAVADVDLGMERDIETASIKRLIAILRSGGGSDVLFNSRRLNKKVTLSLRPQDQEQLEDFLFKEYYPIYERKGK